LAAADLSPVTPTTKKEIAEILEAKLGRPLSAEEQQPDTPLAQLGLDSLDGAELALDVEQRFGFSGDQAPTTLGQLWALAQGLAEKAPPKPPPAEWFRPPADTGPLAILGETIPEAFVARALANPRDVAAADDLAGVLAYERMLVGALVLARRFAPMPAENVGLMLPASVGCDLAVLALQLAGKLPVVLNWTTGPVNLAHAVRAMGLTHVVTSHAFIDRLGIQVEGAEYLWLEEVRGEVGKFELLRMLLTVRWLPGRVRRWAPAAAPDRPAVQSLHSCSGRTPKTRPHTPP